MMDKESEWTRKVSGHGVTMVTENKSSTLFKVDSDIDGRNLCDGDFVWGVGGWCVKEGWFVYVKFALNQVISSWLHVLTPY